MGDHPVDIMSFQVEGREILDGIPHICDESLGFVEDSGILDFQGTGEVGGGAGQGSHEPPGLPLEGHPDDYSVCPVLPPVPWNDDSLEG